MGTEKRERQKTNRALKHQQEVKAAKQQAVKKRALRYSLLAAVGVAGVVVIAWIGGAFSSDEVSAPTTAAPSATDPDGAVTDPPPVPDTECPPTDGSAEQVRDFPAAPPMCLDPDVTYTAEVTTNFGDFSIELDQEQAPVTVNNFVVLARYRYFDDTICHRILPGFVIQCGDPTGSGTGGPGYTIPDEFPEAGAYELGSLAMANTGAPNTGGSQFFVITGPSGQGLPPQYSLFGQVVDGLDTTVADIDAVGNPDPASNGVPPLEEVRIERVTITES